MSSFTESALVKKLLDLNCSQQSIQTLSLWLIHHRKHNQTIVRAWFRELQKAPQNKKLTCMYLANDVIQNSKKKGPEYGKEFGRYLERSFLHIAETCASDEKTMSSLGRILNIWEERNVYDAKAMKDFRNALKADVVGTEEASTTPKPTATEKRRSTDHTDGHHNSKRHKNSSSSSSSTNHHYHQQEQQKQQLQQQQRDTIKSETIEINGTVETHVVLSPHTPAGDPPEPEELIKALLDLEHSASSDAAIRERIANLPSDVSEVTVLNSIEDRDTATQLAGRVNEAVALLQEYNTRLASEMEDRKKLTVMLKDFQAEQKELLTQAEQRLEEYNTRLRKIRDVQREIRNHLNNLPDFKQLPDVTGCLAPLPSAGDLFNIH